MMEKGSLRRADFITSIILIIFGLWVLYTTVSTFPMKDSWGGVQNVWYVSPALFPIFISIGIIILGIILLLNSIKEKGAKTFFEKLAHVKPGMTESMLRFLSIVLILATFVYLNIPRIDFFLSAMFALTVFITMFYLEYGDLLKRFTKFYAIGSLIFVFLFMLGVDQRLNRRITDAFINKLAFTFQDGAFASGDAANVGNSNYYFYLNFNDPTLMYSDNRFKEADANDGSIDDSKPVTITVSGDILTGEDGEEFIASGKVVTNIGKVAPGLTVVMTRMSETELQVALTGNAQKHMEAHGLDDLKFTFQDNAFSSGNASRFANYQKDIRLTFKDPLLTYSTKELKEAETNDGTINNSPPLTITLSGDTLTGKDGEDFVASAKVQTNLKRVAPGLEMSVVRTSPTELELTLTGNAQNHTNANTVESMMVKFKDKAFTSGKASQVEDFYKNDLKVVFNDPMLTYSSTEFWETAADDGTIDKDSPITILLSGDTFSGKDGDDFVAAGKVQTNTAELAPGLTAVVIRRSSTELQVTLAGSAKTHAHADSRENLTFSFQDSAFSSEKASNVVDSAKDDVRINFIDLGLTYSKGAFKEAKANDGTIDNKKPLIITLIGDTLTGEDGEDFVATGKVVSNIEEVAPGLTVDVTRTSSRELQMTLAGNAISHADAADVTKLTLTFLDEAFTLGNADNLAHSTKKDLQIDFTAPTLRYSRKSFKEADINDGSIDESKPMEITLTGGTLTGEDGEDFVATGKAVSNLDEVAPGLTAVVTRKSPTELQVMLAGAAAKHEKAHETEKLALTFQDGAFMSGDAASVANSTVKDLRINFSDPVLSYSAQGFKEASKGGSIDNSVPLTITLTGGTLTGEDGEDFVAIGKVKTNIANVASGLTALVTRTGPTELQVTLTGQAKKHADADDVKKKLAFIFQDEAFTSGDASIVVNAAKSNVEIDFTDLALSYSKRGFKEALTNDGSIDPAKPLKITLSGDTLTGEDGEDFVAAGKVKTNLDEAASGLTAVITRTSSADLELTLTNNATHHTNSNDLFLRGGFRYSIDILFFVFFLLYVWYCWSRIQKLGQEEPKAKFLMALVISIAVPLFTIPLFKYALLVPFPVEGGGIELMNIFWYSAAIKAIRKVTGPYLLLLGIFLIFVAIILAIYFKFMRKTEAATA